MEHPYEDEISLRGLYLILKKRWRLVAGVPVLLAAVALVFSLSLPKTYETRIVFDVKGGSGAAISPAALVEMLQDRFAAADFARSVGETEGVGWAKVKLDDKKGYVVITVRGKTPTEASVRAQRLTEAVQNEMLDIVVLRSRKNYQRELVSLNTQLPSLRARKESLEKVLASMPEGQESAAAKVQGAALLQVGAPPMVAESPDPARAYLRLELAKLEAQIAEKQARLSQIETLLSDEATLRKLAEGAVPLRPVAAPATPLTPVGPRVLLNTALALVLGLFIGVFWVFLQAALEPPPATPEVAEAREVVPSS